jgi:hypothetical protein
VDKTFMMDSFVAEQLKINEAFAKGEMSLCLGCGEVITKGVDREDVFRPSLCGIVWIGCRHLQCPRDELYAALLNDFGDYLQLDLDNSF